MVGIVSVVVFLAYPVAILSLNVTISPSSSCSQPCGSVVNGTSIDDALENIASGDYLQLLPGCHCVQRFRVIGGVTDISVVGVGKGTLVTCATDLGVAFVNVTRLLLQGLTITGCGTKGLNALALNSAVNAVVDFFTQLTAKGSVAVVIAKSDDVTVDHVTIANNTGLGLLGVNVAGQSNFTNNVFSLNGELQCPGSSDLGGSVVGGGASLVFVNYINANRINVSDGLVKLVIENCTFSNNSYCGNELGFESAAEFSETLRRRNYTIGSGGGLCLSLAQQGYAVAVGVHGSTFENNAAQIGSGSNVIWYAGSSDSSIVFSDCTFTGNGLPSQSIGGGGISVYKDISTPPSPAQSQSWISSKAITFLRTNFTRNTASVGAAVFVGSLYAPMYDPTAQVLFESCRFEANSGEIGAAVFIVERKAQGTQKGLLATVRDCAFVSNKVNNEQSSIPIDSGAVLQLYSVTAQIVDSSFLSNDGTAFSAGSSVVIVQGQLEFTSNSALVGGAMRLSVLTSLVVQNHSLLTFTNNSAAISGGAIYVDYAIGQSGIGSKLDCFLYFGSSDQYCGYDISCPNIASSNISMVFLNNRAPKGSILYGSTLDTCFWAAPLKQSLNVTSQPIIQSMYKLSIIFKMDQAPNTSATISTPTSTLTSTLDAGGTSAAVRTYMPGQQFYLTVRSADRLNQTIGTMVSSRTVDAFTLKLGDSGYFLTSATGKAKADARVFGQPNVTTKITLYSLDSYVSSTPLAFTLTGCAFGFVYSAAEGGDCRCSNATAAANAICDDVLKVFNVTSGWWIGPTARAEEGLVYRSCLFDYCAVQDGAKFATVEPTYIAAQCAYSRSGLLCGACDSGYSAVFGTNRCLKCTNDYLALIVVFAAAGVAIIAIILLLRVTVSDGYVNGLLFYASVVSSYDGLLTARLKEREIFIPIFVLNLNTGYETCFFDGMTALDRAGLGFAFPLYLFALMLLFVWLASCSVRVSRWLARSSFTPSKLIATLITLSYNSITQSCFQILGFARVPVFQEDGSQSIVYAWRTDPNVEYFSPLHATLFSVSLLLLITFVIPVPTLLILPSLTSRAVVSKMKPLYDAFVGPLKDKFAFWIGLLFVLRILYFLISSFVDSPLNLLLLGVGFVIDIFFTATAQPYRSKVHNMLHNFFQCNILLLALGAIYTGTYSDGTKSELAFVAVVLSSAYAVALVVLGKFLFLRFPCLDVICKAVCRKRSLQNKETSYELAAKESQGEEDRRNHGIEVTNEAVVRLREPLMDDDGFANKM